MNKMMNADTAVVGEKAKQANLHFSDKQIEGIVEMAQNSDSHRVKVHNNYWIRIMLKLSMDVAMAFIGMDWNIIYALTKFALFTSDNPFILGPPKNHNPFNGVGIITPGAVKIIALTANFYLVM